MRQALLLSNTSILCDTCNSKILQTLSAVKTEDRLHRLRPFHQTLPTPHYPSPRTNSWLPCQRELACGKARIYSNTAVLPDTCNAQISQNLSAARLRDRRPDYLHLHKHRQPRTIPRQALPHTWLPCQRELACGKACFYQIRSYFATPTTSKLFTLYLPSRLRDRLHRTFPLSQTPPLTIPQKLAEFNSATEAHLYTRELNEVILLFSCCA